MILTAQQIIDQALKLIGVLGVGTDITAQEYTDSLLTLNLMVDRWNLTDLLVYSTNPHVFPFVPGKQKYTLGTGGDWDMERPSKIDRISIQYNTNTGTPVEIPLDADFDLEGWQNIVIKNIPSLFPQFCYNNTGYPFMELNFWPIPQGQVNVILYTWDQMPFINALADNVELPTGYTDAIIYNLAIRLAQMFDRVPSPQLLKEAAAAKSDINDINSGSPTIHVDPAFCGRRGSGSIGVRTQGRVVF
jgi:hypothetical protein